MLVKRFLSYFPLTASIMSAGLKSAWQYKLSFIFQISMMVINDLFLLVIWVFFFDRFPSLNGWSFEDTQKLFAMHALAFTFVMFIFGGVLDMARSIEEGSIDQFLTQPRSLLWRIYTNGFRLNVLGDGVFALGMLAYISLNYGWSNLFFIPVAAMFEAWGVLVITSLVQSFGFWLKRFGGASFQYFWALEAPSLYPQNSFVGGMRVLLLTLVPALWVVGIPYSFVSEHSFLMLGVVAVFNVVVTVIMLAVFRKGLRNYGSGNLILINNGPV